jgi:release factor glutamine methyltransferase
MITPDAAVKEVQQRGLERRDAEVLLAHVLGKDRTWLRAHGDEPALDAKQLALFQALCHQRLQQVPVAYLTGKREFYGLTLHVSPDVLDPRPDTEVLVDWALACLAGPLSSVGAPVVADLGTGSGAIALALARHAPQARIVAVDRSPAALAVAQDNAQRLGLAVDWRLGSWLQPLSGERGHLLLSNPPYLAAGDPHLAALHAEPQEALVGGSDGLDDLRRITQGASQWLLSGGWLLVEHGYDQAAPVAELFQIAGFTHISHRCDLAGHTRCTGAQWPGVAR